MSKIVLLAINAKHVHSSLSVWVIAEGVAKYARSPHDISIVEDTINRPVLEIAEAVVEHTPDIVGISVYIWNASMLPGLLDLLREQLPKAVFVLGGPEASHNIKYWLNNGADHVLCGEGEYTFPQFLNAFPERQAQYDLSPKPGVKQKSRSPVFPVCPYTDAYINALRGRLAYIESSRGCPFRCSFCLSAGSGVQYFPLESVKEQIKKLSQSSAKTLKFVDRTFNCNIERAYKLFEYVIGLDTACRFHFEVAADLFDNRTLSLLETATPGRIQFEIGLQSFYEPALRASSRTTDLEKAKRNIQSLMKMNNIHIHVDLIAGLPYEKLSDFMDSFDRAYLLNTHTLQLGFLKLLHGSELRRQADVLGMNYSSKPPYEIKCSPWLSSDDLQIIKHAENALSHTRNKGRFLSTLDYILSVTGERPFSLLSSLGAAVPNHGNQLENYIVRVYHHFVSLPGVDSESLRDSMVFDWLGMVKGKNMPDILKNEDPRRKTVAVAAEKALGHKIRREELAVLHSGKSIYVNRNERDTVTGLYEVHVCE